MPTRLLRSTRCLALASSLLAACVDFEPLGDVAVDRTDAGSDTSDGSRSDAGDAGAGSRLDGAASPSDAPVIVDLAPASDGARDVPDGPDGPDTQMVDAGPDAVDAPAPPDAPLPDGPPPDAPAPPGLVAHLSFDEAMGTTIGDRTGNGNQGTARNGPLWAASTTPGAVMGDFALVLDGQDDHVDVAARTVPRVEAAKTVALWVSPSAATLAAPGQRTLLLVGNAAASAGLQIGTVGGRLAAWQWGDDQGFATATAALTAGFHHVAYTYDGTTHRLYVAGQEVAARALPLRPAVVNTVRVGTYEAPNEMWGGAVDDLRIYDRALHADEIRRLAR